MGSASRMLSRSVAGGVDVLVDLVGVERGVVKVADGEGDDIYSRWL